MLPSPSKQYISPLFQKILKTGIIIIHLVFILLTPRPGTTALPSQTPNTPTILLNNPNFFPLGVWVQSTGNAARFKSLGINLYVGLWNGPTISQLQELKSTDMPVICQQNEIALAAHYHDIILGWLQQDEPDNAQSRKFALSYRPPVLPSIVQELYAEMKKRDPRRPILLNLGQGVAWSEWEGRGTRTDHPEDYKEYVKGGDIISFDIYPVTHRHPAVRGKLEFVAEGVQRLKALTTPQQKVWNVIGVSRVNDPDLKPTPLQVRSQVWMSIIHGSRGIIYFVHQFKPRFIEAAVFEDPEMMDELTKLNHLIQTLAVVINSPDTNDIKKLIALSPNTPIAAITKRYESSLYLFSVAMRNKETTGSFEFNPAVPDQIAEVIGENRTIQIRNGILEDRYLPYEPHIYKIDRHSSATTQ